MKIAVCIKAVPDNDEIRPLPNRSISVGGSFSIGQYDLNAIEAAAQLKTSTPGCEVLAVTVCATEDGYTSKIKKSVLSKGPDALYGVCDAGLSGADSLVTASALKSVIEKIGDIDLVICGEGSGDAYCQMTGNMLGGLLGWTTLNSISKITVTESGLTAERSVESETEDYRIKLPAVLSVTSDINIPRISSLKDIMAAGKKPSTQWSLNDVNAETSKDIAFISTLAPENMDRKKVIFKGEDEETVAKLYEQLRKVL